MDPRVFELFSLALSEFTAARNALAAVVKKEGDAARSKQIKAFARPTASAWAVNQLFRSHGNALNALLTVGAELRAAAAASLQGEGAAELRAAQRLQTERVAALRSEGARLLEASAQPPTTTTLDRLSRSLQAISSRGSFAPHEAGCLCADVDPPSFEELATMVGGGEPIAVRTEAPRTTPQSAPQPPPSSTRLRVIPTTSDADVKKRADAIAAAQDALDVAKERIDSVSRAASALMSQLTQLRQATQSAKANLEAAREGERLAISAEGDANERAASLAKSLESAKQELAKSQSALEKANY